MTLEEIIYGLGDAIVKLLELSEVCKDNNFPEQSLFEFGMTVGWVARALDELKKLPSQQLMDIIRSGCDGSQQWAKLEKGPGDGTKIGRESDGSWPGLPVVEVADRKHYYMIDIRAGGEVVYVYVFWDIKTGNPNPFTEKKDG